MLIQKKPEEKSPKKDDKIVFVNKARPLERNERIVADKRIPDMDFPIL